MTDLMDRLDREPEAWLPEAGDKITGRIVEVGEAGHASEYGKYPILIIESVDVKTGEIVETVLHCFHTVLRNAIERVNPEVGDTIGVAYKGLKEGGAFGTFENYRVVIERANVPF